MSKKNSVILLGAKKSGKHALIAGIDNLSKKESKPSEALKPVECVTIKTKYYSADLQFLVCSDASGSHSFDDVQGVVLVFNAASKDAFTECTKLWTALPLQAREAAGLRLLVATHADTDEDPEKTAEMGVAWSLDNQFEFVACNCLRPREGSAGREKESVGRVLEALQSHMWTNMRMSKPTARTAPACASPTTEGISPAPTTKNNTKPAPTTTTTTPTSTTPSTITSSPESAVVAESAGQVTPPPPPAETEILNQMLNDAKASAARDGDPTPLLVNGDNPFPVPAPDSVEDDEDREAEMFARMIERARQVRNKAREGNLSDAERRALAEKTMLEFMSMFGGDDDDDESSEEP